MKPVDVRQKLVEALRVDLVGPDHHSDLADEMLPQSPSRWYLTGFLVPLEADDSQRSDETVEDEVDELDEAQGADDANTPEPASAKRAFFPSSIGMSILATRDASEAAVTVRWGDYEPLSRTSGKVPAGEEAGHSDAAENPENGSAPPDASGETENTLGFIYAWKRVPREETLNVPLPTDAKSPQEAAIPNSAGLALVTTVRPIEAGGSNGAFLSEGTRSVSIFLVNKRKPAEDEVRDKSFVFQAEIEVKLDTPLVPRPNLRGVETDDWDETVADLQYRNTFEYAVGHGIATDAIHEDGGTCRAVRTRWIPDAEVELVAPSPIEGIELRMEELANLPDAATAKQKLGNLVDQYRAWIDAQRQSLSRLTPNRTEAAEELLRRAGIAANRIEAGIGLLADADVVEAFRTANRVMAIAARQRFGVMTGKEPESVDAPAWRPFQLAFLLLNLPGVADPEHSDREVVDLLFFPTGGGKTEAYLGLAAFTLVLRRLRNPGVSSAGLSVLMRYTLRLLTLDQLGRASTLICALELERQKNPEKLGPWPIEIGLWVGSAATPNRMGKKGDNDSYSARAKTIAFKNDDRKASPIPLEECPWCGTKFSRNSFQLVPNQDEPNDLRITCANRRCVFTRDHNLPILSVDEPIYRRLPCFIIATVDKFAAMPWTGEVGGFFGKVDRFDNEGFYGPCDTGHGRTLEKSLLPSDLVIQDELHLISGPLGTLVGLYETAIDALSTREVDGKKVRPKVIASTATVRRAQKQIQALFARRHVDIFPPPGPDVRDSFFAKTVSSAESNARQYVGIAAQGRSLKVVLLRAYLALMGAAQKAYREDGGKRNKDNAADPYMTLLGYFNSLRELGGSRRIIEDEVGTRLAGYYSRKRLKEREGLFVDRRISYEVVELTSRVSTDKVAEAKRKLSLPFYEDDRVDVAIATNMISVGLDITRLGLMVVLGQPRTSAEYIQATSRVGRQEERPGLVVTLLNIHRPRDRSHYERFSAFHDSFYRSVEATSVTPFSPRALDRGLAGTLVAIARQGDDILTPPLGAEQILNERANLDFVVDALMERASMHASMTKTEEDALRQTIRDRAVDLLDEWSGIASDYTSTGVRLQYQQREVGAAKQLLYEFLNPELKTLPPRHKKFRANRSMRDVEPSVNLWLKTLDNVDVEEPAE